MVVFICHLILTGADQSMDQHSQIQLMHKRRNLLAQYSKLILHGILDMQNAAFVLRFYTKACYAVLIYFYTDFGDILKSLVNKCRELDKLGCARAVIVSLCNFYEEMKRSSENHYVDPNSDDFTALRELAKRLSGVFGSDPVKSREALAVIHRIWVL
uniref:Uncharacterized protein n=1 Tax=Parascaris equorum TaxID=6256 RepID=A0A914RF41_PAREQ